MIKLQPIFSDNALFLHSSPLTLRGITDAASASARLVLDGKVITEISGATANGTLELTLDTPAASFEE